MTESKEKVKSGKALSTLIKVIVGLALIVLGALAIIRWLPSLITVIKGCIGLFLILAGFIALAIAKE